MSLRREMLAFAKDVLRLKVPPAIERAGLRLVEQLTPKRQRKTLKYRAPPPRPAAVIPMSEIRLAVIERANGICEACGKPFTSRDPFTLDHWLNGNGRRRQKQSVETCWGIHERSCHMPWRQEYLIPAWGEGIAAELGISSGVEFWNHVFRQHCERHGFPFIPHIVHQALRRRA